MGENRPNSKNSLNRIKIKRLIDKNNMNTSEEILHIEKYIDEPISRNDIRKNKEISGSKDDL